MRQQEHLLVLGFMSKCAERGVDPEEFTKSADRMIALKNAIKAILGVGAGSGIAGGAVGYAKGHQHGHASEAAKGKAQIAALNKGWEQDIVKMREGWARDLAAKLGVKPAPVAPAKSKGLLGGLFGGGISGGAGAGRSF